MMNGQVLVLVCGMMLFSFHEGVTNLNLADGFGNHESVSRVAESQSAESRVAEPQSSEPQVEKSENNRKVLIAIGEYEFTATLEENETAKEFMELLPLSISMDDVNGNEKYFKLGENIKNNEPFVPGEIKSGDIMCYGEAGLVLFYQTFSTSYSYVPIGRIDNTEKLQEAIGGGSVIINFS